MNTPRPLLKVSFPLEFTNIQIDKITISDSEHIDDDFLTLNEDESIFFEVDEWCDDTSYSLIKYRNVRNPDYEALLKTYDLAVAQHNKEVKKWEAEQKCKKMEFEEQLERKEFERLKKKYGNT